MDEVVIRAMQKWPGIPAVYGWLALDRRGSWRIRTSEAADARFEPIGNVVLRDFVARNYQPDGRGCWYFQNGPQRVFVSLAYAPLVFRLEGGRLLDHCGREAGTPNGAWLDEEGTLVLQSDVAVGILDSRDLGICADGLEAGAFVLGGTEIPLGALQAGEIEDRFGFVRDPRP